MKKVSMEEINRLYRLCGLKAGKEQDDISYVRDFPIPNKLISDINPDTGFDHTVKKEYGYTVYSS